MMKKWLIAGAVVGCFVGGSMGACSSSGGTGSSGFGASSAGPTSGNPTSSTGTPASSTTTTGGGSTPASSSVTTTGGGGPSSSSVATTSGGGAGGSTTGGGGGGAGGSSTCKPPGTLHPPKAGEASIYCPFSGVDGGKADYCQANADPTQAQHCCETPEGSTTPSACVTGLTTACVSGSVDWQCEDPVADCLDTANPVCCAPGASIGLGGMMNGMACQNFAHHMTGTSCVPAGQCNGIIMCTSNSECPTGMTCTAFSKSGNQVGGCM